MPSARLQAPLFVRSCLLLVATQWQGAPEDPGWQRYPWATALEQQLEDLRRRYGERPLDLIVVHHGIYNRDPQVLEFRRKLEESTGRPVIALPSYGLVGDEGRESDGSEMESRVRRDHFKAASQYLRSPSKLRVDYVSAWERILEDRPGSHLSQIIFHSGAGINANTSEKSEIINFLEKHQGMVDRMVFAMTNLKEDTALLLERHGVKAIQIVPEDRVAALTKPALEYADPNGGANPLGLKSLAGWIIKFPAVMLWKTGKKHSLLDDDGNVRRELLDVLVDQRSSGPSDSQSSPLPSTPPSPPPGPEGRTSDTGGIDFTSVELRYLSERGDAEPVLSAIFRAMPDAFETGSYRETTGLVWDSFFTFLALPSSAFWVNLHPAEPDRIIDPEFARSDAGRILLTADEDLKHDLGRLTHPDSPVGRRFWAALDEVPNAYSKEGLSLSFRVWIVPGAIHVVTTEDGIIIVDSKLNVELESEYLAGRGCLDKTDVQLQSKAEAVYRTMVLPELQRAINESPRYDDLRQVFSALIMSTWYESLHSERGAFAYLIDSGDAGRWHSTPNWSPRQVFDRYLVSVNEGEYHVVKKSSTHDGQRIITTVRTYFMGGVDFTQVHLVEVSVAELRGWRDIVENLTAGLLVPGGAWSASSVWFGGTVGLVRMH